MITPAGGVDGRRARTRRRATVRRELPFTVVLAVAAAGVLFAALRPEHWLRGMVVVGVAMMLGAVLRTVLPETRAGLLAVRTKGFDALCFLLLAAGIVGIGVLLPR